MFENPKFIKATADRITLAYNNQKILTKNLSLIQGFNIKP